MKEQRCHNCRFVETHPYNLHEDEGYCCRFPPSVDCSGQAVWPVINKEHWCGEWRPRDELKLPGKCCC